MTEIEEPWWLHVSRWIDGHWRICALAIGAIIAALIVGVIVHRLNETDARLRRALCVEVAFLESLRNPTPQTVKLVAQIRGTIDCPPPAPR